MLSIMAFPATPFGGTEIQVRNKSFPTCRLAGDFLKEGTPNMFCFP